MSHTGQHTFCDLCFCFLIGFRLERHKEKKKELSSLYRWHCLQYATQPLRALEPSSLYYLFFSTKMLTFSHLVFYDYCCDVIVFLFLVVYLMFHSMFLEWCSVQYIFYDTKTYNILTYQVTFTLSSLQMLFPPPDHYFNTSSHELVRTFFYTLFLMILSWFSHTCN